MAQLNLDSFFFLYVKPLDDTHKEEEKKNACGVLFLRRGVFWLINVYGDIFVSNSIQFNSNSVDGNKTFHPNLIPLWHGRCLLSLSLRFANKFQNQLSISIAQLMLFLRCFLFPIPHLPAFHIDNQRRQPPCVYFIYPFESIGRQLRFIYYLPERT